MCKVSILTAAYNAGSYIRSCLDSLVRQTLREIEIICIDDCSTDNTLTIIKEYADRDNRIKIVALTKNQGQAHARNVGLRHTTGEYICMLDADDWLADDALSQAVTFMEQHNEADCVLFDVVMWTSETENFLYPMKDFTMMLGKDAFRLSLTWAIHGLYMIRRAIHIEYPYDETCRLYSDDNTTRMHYLASRQVGHCKGRYYYRQHANSATHALTPLRFDYLRANESMALTMEHYGIDIQLRMEYENHRWENLIGTYMIYHISKGKLTSEERALGLKEIRQYRRKIHREWLFKKTTHKFGYHPMPTWTLFHLEEWLYFTIRDILRKTHWRN